MGRSPTRADAEHVSPDSSPTRSAPFFRTMRTVEDLLKQLLQHPTFDETDLADQLGVRVQQVHGLMKVLAGADLLSMIDRHAESGIRWRLRTGIEIMGIARERGLLVVRLPRPITGRHPAKGSPSVPPR